MEYKEQAKTYELSGDFREAIKNYLQAALEFGKSEVFEDSKTEVAECLSRAAACFVELQEYSKAIKVYQNAINAYSQSELDLAEKYQNIANCCADIATCLLNPNPKIGSPNYDNAIKFLQKAKQFTVKRAKVEDPVLQKFVYERAAIYNSFIALINLFLDMPESSKLIINESLQILQKHNISGFGVTFTDFIYNLLNSQFEDAKQKLQIIEAESNNLSRSGPTFQAILLATLHNALTKYVPEVRIHLTKVVKEEKGVVYLSQKTFMNILLHTLFYANYNIERSEWKETYGLLIGNIKEDDLLIAEAVPITSGEKFEVAFEEKHYAKAAIYDSLAIDKGLFTIGWYHSHPGLGLFLSPTDILNQLGYQNLNPKAIALVFDFTKVTEKYLGFEIFRLDDPELGVHSDFHKVNWKIVDLKKKFQKDIPKLLENFIKNAKNLIDKSPKISIYQIAESLEFSEFVVGEILFELYQTKSNFPNTLFDEETNFFVKEEIAYRTVINLLKDINPLDFSIISQTLNISPIHEMKMAIRIKKQR